MTGAGRTGPLTGGQSAAPRARPSGKGIMTKIRCLRCRTQLGALGVVLLAAAAFAAPTDTGSAEIGTRTLFPGELLYPAPVAAPLRPMFALTVAQYLDSDIPDAGDTWFAKTGLQHDSSHIGDEYAERTGRERIDYTREEWILAVSRGLPGTWRVYAETAYQLGGGNPALQKDWRIQGGCEFEGRERFLRNRAAPYGPVNLNALEESDWDPSVTVQSGLVMSVGSPVRRYRAGIQYSRGRSVIGEFFEEDEEFVSFGLWLDL